MAVGVLKLHAWVPEGLRRGPMNRTYQAIAWCAVARTFRSATGQWEKSGLTLPVPLIRCVVRLPRELGAWIVHGQLIGAFLQQAGEKSEFGKAKGTIPEQAVQHYIRFLKLFVGLCLVDELPDMLGRRLEGDLLQTDILKKGTVFMGSPVGQVVADIELLCKAVERNNRWRPPRLEIERIAINGDIQKRWRVVGHSGTVCQCFIAVPAGERYGV